MRLGLALKLGCDKNSPGLAEPFLKLREDLDFVHDMTQVITRKINDENKCQTPVNSSYFCDCLNAGHITDTNRRLMIALVMSVYWVVKYPNMIHILTYLMLQL